MKIKDEMPKDIKQWMVDVYGKEDHNFRHGASAIDFSKEAHLSTVSGLAGV